MTSSYLPPVSPLPSAPKSRSIGPSRSQNPVSSRTSGSSFADFLHQANQEGQKQGLTVSAHASQRLAERGIQFSAADWEQVNHALSTAERKGAKDVYLVHNRVGLVVNVPNHTVVTAMNHGPQTIVTNIDTVVVVS